MRKEIIFLTFLIVIFIVGCCQAGPTENYRCNGNVKEQEIKDTICGTRWQAMTPCQYGCNNNDCCELLPMPFCSTDKKSVMKNTTSCGTVIVQNCSDLNGDYKCKNGFCVHIASCGDNVCEEESGENNMDCPSDCALPCQSKFCNDKVQVFCSAGKDCGEQEELFDDYLEMQTSVFNCLSDYFQFVPPRVPYEINPTHPGEFCTRKEGCCCPFGGRSGMDKVVHHGLNGFVPYGHYYPTLPIHLMADEHETTHYFLFHMVSNHPSWFSEAIAIHTNEMVGCDTQAQLFQQGEAYEEVLSGDAYLTETPTGSGVNMDDGTFLNEDFYIRLRDGKTHLSRQEKTSPHTIGTLWIIGLKVDYGCEEECVRNIVLKLKELGSGEVIKPAAESVVGKDLSALFKLLDI